MEVRAGDAQRQADRRLLQPDGELSAAAVARPLSGDPGPRGGSRQQYSASLWKLRPQSPAILDPRLDEDGGVVVNALGLRGPLPPAKQADELRILSLGESTTAGLRVPIGETYSAVLERALKPRDECGVTVVNAGTGGYSLAQGVALARLHTTALEPDLILTYFGYNDFLPRQFRAQRDAAAPEDSLEITDRELLDRRAQLRNRALFWLQRHSNFARYAAQRNSPEFSSPRRGRGPRVPATDRLALYNELQQFCEAREIRLVVLVPIYREFNRHEPFLRDLADAHGFEVVDLPALLGPDLGDRHAHFFDPVHPKAGLNKQIGNAIAEYLGAQLKP